MGVAWCGRIPRGPVGDDLRIAASIYIYVGVCVFKMSAAVSAQDSASVCFIGPVAFVCKCGVAN